MTIPQAEADEGSVAEMHGNTVILAALSTHGRTH